MLHMPIPKSDENPRNLLISATANKLKDRQTNGGKSSTSSKVTEIQNDSSLTQHYETRRDSKNGTYIRTPRRRRCLESRSVRLDQCRSSVWWFRRASRGSTSDTRPASSVRQQTMSTSTSLSIVDLYSAQLQSLSALQKVDKLNYFSIKFF